MARNNTDSDLAVETTSGQVHGFLDRGAPNWRGVPYGRVTERFRPPSPTEPEGPVKAAGWGPISWQVPLYAGKSWSAIFPDSVEREDCLNLNIWSCDTTPAQRRPVLVWFHPGGRVFGSGSTPLVDAWVYAARHNAVVVTANYRLGPWGWLYLGALDQDFADSVNLPILDQVLLLRWIRENIAQFGGDPENVTLFGMSTGACDVGTMLGVPAARGLFHKAALYSGNAENQVPLERAAAFTEEFLAAAGELASTSRDLAGLPNAGFRHIHRKLLQGGLVRYTPPIDGGIIPKPPLETLREGNAADVAVLVSVTADEARVYDVASPDVIDLMYAFLVGPDDPGHDEKVKALSERLYFEPADRLLTAVHAGGGQAWAQTFDYHPTISPVADNRLVAGRPVHGVDISALFIDPEGTVGTETDRAVGAIEQEALMRFARDGQPGWKQWSPETPTAQRIKQPS